MTSHRLCWTVLLLVTRFDQPLWKLTRMLAMPKQTEKFLSMGGLTFQREKTYACLPFRLLYLQY